MTKTKILRITYRDETIRSRGRETLAQAVNGEEYDPLIQVNITEPHDLARLMSEENLELLTAIVEREPESISELVELVDRDYKSVHRNLTELEEFGVIEYDESGARKRPILRGGAEELELEVTVQKPESDGDIPNSASV